MTTTVSLADARAAFSKLVESASSTHEHFVITRNGDRAAVLLGAEDSDALMETLDVLSRPDEVQEVHHALQQSAGGDVSSLDDVRDALIARGRLPG